jgi:uncharacterized protein (UPF0332 family)
LTPQANRSIEKARKLLEDAGTMQQSGLNDQAGRTAYLAAFHGAQALIFERTGRVLKTHKGVHAEFLRLTKDERRFRDDLRRFLSRAYNLKAVADYESGPDSGVPEHESRAALATAAEFLAGIDTLLATP